MPEIVQLAAGPIPARNRCAGEWIAPDETMNLLGPEFRLTALYPAP